VETRSPELNLDLLISDLLKIQMHGFPKSLSAIKSLSCFQLVISVYSSSKTSLRTLLLKRLIEQIYITIGSRGLDGMNNLACS
jgi:hypothetical protein